ncbi:MAG: SDR family NAD(P)-dependent oxidoreductase [Bryobacterales bacterium]|nr:SDR family NAD(P)-dependent oxidoreductase [Bryobacterales bacterium]
MKADGYSDPSGELPSEPEVGQREVSRNARPIAIVGMACRFPGAEGLEAFWRLLAAGENAVTEGVPGSGAGRVGELFPDAAVKSEACRFGGFIDGIDQFDAEFFRISPVEADLLDPQQRMMLETSWQALEDAGVDPERLKGSRTGVFAGISNNEYRGLILSSSDTSEPAASLYSVTGTSLNTAIGRVSFVMGLEGPALSIDTACSSSLVAVHQAAVALQRGEADLALAGGVHAILSGRLFELRANAGMLAPDGRCKTFDAAANGYVRGEGCGIVVLKRLSEAEADGDRIWGVIRGSAVNQDGASAGLTVPNEAAQERVIEEALSRAGVLPSEVDYVETHGTGTEVGDPIELRSTAAAYGKGRTTDRPLLIGSVKTNLGHLESAAGVAALIKVMLAMKQGAIPKHLHFRKPNPKLDWEQLPLRVASVPMDWPLHPNRPAMAAMSGFGWSGTNAHVVVEGYGAPDGDSEASSGMHSPAGSERPVEVFMPETVADLLPEKPLLQARETRFLPLSGKSDQALKDLAGRYLSWLDERSAKPSSPDAEKALLADMAWTAGVGRSHFGHRAGLVFQDAESLREGLCELAAADAGPVSQPPSKVAFVYTGQGSHWVGMGESLYHNEPVVRAVLDRCDAMLRQDRGISLLDVMFGRPGSGADLSDQAWTQPAVFALECALTALWSSLGIRPSVVLGHSFGEIAAAQAAGVFSLEEGLRFAAARGALTAKLPSGAMAAIFSDVTRVEAAIDALNAASAGAGLSIAAYNGAHQVVSGPEGDVEAILERFLAEDIRVSRLHTRNAFHSALVEPMLDELEAVASRLKIAPPALTLVTNVTGQVLESGELLDGEYWRRHTREPVAFGPGIETLARLKVDLVVEIGPNAVLGPMASLAWPESADGSGPPVALSSLLRPSAKVSQAEADRAFITAVAKAYRTGLPVSFAGLFAAETRRRIALPSYPFQRRRHWLEAPKRRRLSAGHPLLGDRHESASGEIVFETELFPSDPAWLNDHKVFGRFVVPGALYGVMAASACPGAEDAGSVVVEDMQLHNPLIFPEEESGDDASEAGRKVQVLLDASGAAQARQVQILSKGRGDEGWTLHAEARVSSTPGVRAREVEAPLDLAGLKADLSPVDIAAFYRAKADVGIGLGASFRTLEGVWARPGEAVGELAFPAGLGRNGLHVHPLLLDGCFQVLAAARNPGGSEDGVTYLPFGWERLWLTNGLPDRLICHVRLKEDPRREQADEPPEVQSGDLRIYDSNGVLIGGLSGYSVKRATRASLLAAVEGLKDLLYEVVWRDKALAPGMPPADFLPSPLAVGAESGLFTRYLAAEGVGAEDRAALLEDLERLSRSYALATLDKLGWERKAGAAVVPEDLRRRLQVIDDHKRLFRRMLEMLAKSGVLDEAGDGFVVAVGSGDPLPEGMPGDPDRYATRMAGLYAHGSNEIGLFRRSGGALAQVLRDKADPLTLLFSSGEPSAADLYLKAPVARAANRMLSDAIQALLAGLPDGRRLRVLEVGAGTGSATASVLPELPKGQFDYTYTDISAGFFSEAETRFGDGAIEYRVLDIEKDPLDQGFESHGYDLVIASNVLHATRYLEETLAHCRELLAPSGHLVALENLRGQGWLDLTFGQLDGWWRFADSYRPHHALASPAVWRQALRDVGFGEVVVLGVDESESAGTPDRGVIVAQGPAEVTEAPGVWVLAADKGGMASELAAELASRNQTVVLAVRDGKSEESVSGVLRTTVDMERRESWRSLLKGLADDVPLSGVVHLAALDGHGPQATTGEMAEDVKRAAASALSLVQGLTDSDRIPTHGVWLITRGAQMLERERAGQLAGATLWGLGKVLAREASHLQPRMIDLDPGEAAPLSDVVNELLYPDLETHIAYRFGHRQCARLVRAAAVTDRLALPDEPGWALEPDAGGSLDGIQVMPLPERSLEPGEIRVAIEAFGLNFRDVFIAIGLVDDFMGGEFCGRVLEVGANVSSVAVGDRVVGMTFRAFASETVTLQDLVTPAPPGFSVTELATIPTAFVSAALSFDLAGLKTGDRVLIHAGAGGVGLAAIQLAQAAGAEVFATASARKQAYVRSLGVEHVFDSRTTAFGKEIIDATDGAGVDMVLNSLTGEGFIEASLSCLARGGRFVEMARVDILSEEEMAAVRPDVTYAILKIDVLKEEDPAHAGDILRRVMRRLVAGELTPLIHARWPLAETGSAMKCMRAARHVGKIVLTNSPLARGWLRDDRTYLVTGGLGGLGCVLADWLADRGAGAIVLNGRRPPDAEAEEVIRGLRERGVTVQVELADVTEADAVDAMLARMDATLPPLGGVIHSVGVLADASLANQNWDRFEQVLWPKVLGAWHLHRATADRDLDLFVLFSSIAGILGNPGQANHSSANAFLDQLAAHRRARGLPGQAIAWGAWSGLGEAEEQRERISRRREAYGSGWFTPQQGLRAFDQLVRQDAATAVVMAMDWSLFGEAADTRPSLLEDLLSPDEDGKADAAASPEDLMSGLRESPPAAREELLVSFLQREAQAVLRMPSVPEPTVGVFDLGMDSLMAVEFRNRLNRALDGEYAAPNTLVFDYPDISALARHLAGKLGGLGSSSAPQVLPVPAQAPKMQREADGIAIVGMACRFPGAPDLPAFWSQLEAGSDAVTDGRGNSGSWGELAQDLPAEYAAYRQGGFVEGIEQFDSRFFRIAPIEARMMDPRQRMLLETSWQALEDAGMDPDHLRGSRTGIYAGISTSEYRELMAGPNYGLSYLGTAGSMTVGRVSFALGLEGPTMPVELNCASSLVAVHHAVAALQRGEVDMALVGGAHAVLSPDVTREMAELGMLSANGRCRAFDASADGFVRSEGCGMIVLKRLSEAEVDSDRIWGVIRGSAVNQNGASAGPTVPNGPAQERVIEEALTQGSIAPAEVDYLEAHGAGSAFGDPIEVQAAAAVYGKERKADRPLLIGSVKTNIGHLEPAAGIAGLIKAVLAMKRGVIPKNLHFRDPNPHLDWNRLPVRVVSAMTDWPCHSGRPPRAGVSAFGISGTNAHVVVEGYGEANGAGPIEGSLPVGPLRSAAVSLPESMADLPLSEQGEFRTRATRLLPLSGKTDRALRELAERYLSWLDERAEELASETVLADMAWTAGVGRSHFDYRAGVVFRDAVSLRDGLKALLNAEERPKPAPAPKVAFVYAGEGSQWVGMGLALYESEPVVRAVLDRCDAMLGKERGASLLDVMFGRSGAGGALNDPAWVQPAIYALECALATLWSSVEIRPSVVVGQGIGELAAAQAAGVFGLEEGLRIAADQSVREHPEGISAVPPSLAFVSSVTGRLVGSRDAFDEAYWQRQEREPVAFDRCVESLSDLGVQVVAEIGPRAVLGPIVTSAWPESPGGAAAPVVLSSLWRDSQGNDGFVEAVAGAYEAGLAVSFAGLFAGEERRRVSLPSYPFQRRRHWIDVPKRTASSPGP